MSTPRRWKLLNIDPGPVQDLFGALKIHRTLCALLVHRGIQTYEQARKFFRPSMEDLHDPFLMKDMEKAVARIKRAMADQEKILVFGDYDVDGTTSVACMYQFLKKRHAETEFYIPNRNREGYGISKAGIDYAFVNQYSLIISLDCGIKSVELIVYARDLGIDFIVCDHHLPDQILPPAVAILNPKQKNCNYPFKELCGCGVGFKLITALCLKLHFPISEAFQYLDLVATAIAADIVPITGENRVLCYYGLKKINSSPNLGIKALRILAGYKENLNVQQLAFIIAPRVNAAGRMDDARKAVLMFVAETYEKALEFAQLLQSDNINRKETDERITEEALLLIEEEALLRNKKTTVVYRSHWHKGVVGIVASRLMEQFYRPTIVLTQSGEIISGSARSVMGFNVYEAVHQCKELLIGYGGHFYAAGLTLKTDNLEAFCEKFEKVVEASIHPDLLIPELPIDGELRFSDINQPFYNILCQMEPFGPENPYPIFIARGVYDRGGSILLKERHIRFLLTQDGIILSGIGFNMAEKMPLVQSAQSLDIAFKIEENLWKDQTSLQLKIIDLRLSPNDTEVQKPLLL
ncbi:MAG: single-stranded-DNA-specific exonuclease RecJ [Flavisolibacter sp.]